MRRKIYTEGALVDCLGQISKAYRESGYLSVSWSDVHNRSVEQNKLAFGWYATIASTLSDLTTEEARWQCKLYQGVPIMRRDCEEFAQVYDSTIKALPVETKLRIMAYWPVTSLMSVQQMSEYLQNVQAAYRERVPLQFPDDPLH